MNDHILSNPAGTASTTTSPVVSPLTSIMASGTVVAEPVAPRMRVARKLRSDAVDAVIVGSGAGMALAASLLTASDRPTRSAHASAFPTVRRTHRVETAADAADLLATLPADTIVIQTAMSDQSGDLALSGSVRVYSAYAVIEGILGRTIPELMPADAPTLTSPWLGSTGKRALDLTVASFLLIVTLPILLIVGALVAVAARALPLERSAAGSMGPRSGLLRFRQPATDTAARGDRSLAERIDAGSIGRIPALLDVLPGRAALVGPALVTGAGQVTTSEAMAGSPLARPGVLSWDLAAGRGVSDRRPIQQSFDQFYLRHAAPRRDGQVVAAFVLSLPAAIADLFRTAPRSPAHTNQIEADAPAADAASPVLSRALIVGAGNAGQLLALALPRRQDIGLLPVGFVDDQSRLTGRHIEGQPVLGVTADIPALVQAHRIDVIVLAMPSANSEDHARVVAHARTSTARVLSMPDIGSLLRAESAPMELRRVDLHEVLGRPPVQALDGMSEAFISGKRVLITGAAGSIGQELTRQVARFSPAAVIALDINETGLFDLNQELTLAGNDVPFHSVVASVTNTTRLASIFATYQPEIVFHAAAYKHVPMMERHPQEAVFVNAIGTRRVAEASAKAGVGRFVLISTDKAVRPSSVMGATKRAAELAVKTVVRETGMSGCSVRFGNVLGSRGSVIPTFEKQIDMGGPVTVTDPNMRRFFMTIPEAASLTIQAGAFGESEAVYMLDMGEEVYILDLARRMIELRGMVLGRDIDIVYSGLRPGEKLREELALSSEVSVPTPHSKISILEEPLRGMEALRALSAQLSRLGELALTEDVDAIRTELFRLVEAADRIPHYLPTTVRIEDRIEERAKESMPVVSMVIDVDGEAIGVLANQDVLRTAG